MITTIQKIKNTLNKIKVELQSHGGNVEFINFNEKSGILKVKLTGMCSHCPMASETLKYYIEEKIKKIVPEVKKVVQ